MLGHLIRKEILDHLLSLRFLILSGIGALVMWLSLFSGYTYYRACLTDYRQAQAVTEERIQQMMNADRVVMDPYSTWQEIGTPHYLIHKPPTPMSIFVRGLEPHLGRSALGRWKGLLIKLSPASTEPIIGLFPPLDLGRMVQFVLSLFALLLTYDAVCGEKEAGTLRLVVSFPVPRDRLLIGKLFGALIPTLSAFGLPLILGIGGVALMPDVQLTGPELVRLGWILLAFGTYLFAFMCVGLLVSSSAHRPATAFALLLTFWVLSMAVAPRLSLIISEGFRPAPSFQEYMAERYRIDGEESDKYREVMKRWDDAHPASWGTPEGREARSLYVAQAMDRAHDLVLPQMDRLEEAFKNRYQARTALAVALGRFSPAFLLKNAVIRLADTGLDRHQRFEAAYEQHRERDRAWFQKAAVQDFLKRGHPAKYGAHRWDVSDMPRFVYQDASPDEGVRAAMGDVGLLALWGGIAFLGAYVRMLKYDLR